MSAHIIIAGGPADGSGAYTEDHPAPLPRVGGSTHIRVPKIDVDVASRDKLVAHIEELEWLLGSILPEQPEIERLREIFGISKQRAAILATLSSGRVATNDHLAMTIGRFEDELAYSTIKAQIWHVRKALEPFGVAVNVVWGVGYQIPPESVRALSAIVSGEA